MRKTCNLSLELEELRGEGIERAKLYLAKLCSIKFPESNKEWNEIQKLNKIRNCIVHADGDIRNTRNTEKLINIIKSTGDVSLNNERSIRIGSTYIPSVIKVAEIFLEHIYNEAFKDI